MVLNENEVRRDVIRIERFYQRRGFDDVRVTYRIEDLNREWRKSLVFEIVENAPIRISNVDFKVVSPPQDSTLIFEDEDFNSVRRRLPFREGNRYETVNHTEIEGRLVGALRNLGFPYATSEIQAEVDSTTKTADMVIESHPGPRARFDSVIVEGSQNFAPEYVVRESGITKENILLKTNLGKPSEKSSTTTCLGLPLYPFPISPRIHLSI